MTRLMFKSGLYGRRFSLYMLICELVFQAFVSFGAPYFGTPFTYSQPDGEEITVYVWGDEFYAVAETLDGYTVTKDLKTGQFCYAKVAPNGKGFISTGRPIGKGKPPAGLKKGLRLPPAARAELSKKRRDVLGYDSRGRLKAELAAKLRPQDFGYKKYSPAAEKEIKRNGYKPRNPNAPLPREDTAENITIEDISVILKAGSGEEATTEIPPPLPAPPSSPTVNNRIGLVLLASFPDRQSDIVFSQAQVDNYFNDPNYTEFGNATSIYGYFSVQSNGKLSYNCIVTAYFTAANNRDYYVTDQGVSFGVQARWLINEGIDKLAAEGFDFTQCDGDGNGVIDGVNCFYAGVCVNGWYDDFGLWPHKSSSSNPSLTAGGLASSSYQYQITDMTLTDLRIGTVCHENGHMLCNFPDLYAYNASSGGAASIDKFSLMASGNYGGSRFHPTNVDPYLKNAAGWATIVDVDSTSSLRASLDVDNNTFYRYLNPSNPKEYFIMELRDNTGYEGPYGGHLIAVNPTAGLVIYHAKEDGKNTYSSIITTNNPNCVYTTPYELMIVEDNPTGSYTPWYDDPTPDSGDAFESGDEIDDTTTPSAKFWSSSGRTVSSGMWVHDISTPADTVTFVIGDTPAGSPVISTTETAFNPVCDLGTDAASQRFSINNSGGGTLNYTISDNQTWLSVDVSSGDATTETDPVNITYSTSGLGSGSYPATITIEDSNASNSPYTITVNLTVNPQPVMTLSTTNIVENGIAGEAGPQVTLAINNTGGGTMTYTLSKTQSWLSLSPASGTVVAETDTVYINLDATALVPGSYNDTITVTSPEVANSPQTIAVAFDVNGDDIVVTSPNGGETFISGTSTNIAWVSGIGGNVSIHLLKNGSLDSVIVSSTANDGSYTWNIPESKSGSDFRVRVTSLDINPGFYDDSNANFSIQLPPLLDEDFDTAGTLPSGWTQAQISGGATWKVQTGGGASGGSNPATAHSGANNVTLYLNNTGDNKTRLYTPAFDCAGYTNLTLRFWHTQAYYSPDQDFLNIFYSTNGGSSWVWIAGYSNSVTSWTERNLPLPGVSTNCKVAFEGNAKFGYGVCVDDVSVNGDYSGGSPVIVTKSGGSVDVTEGGATDTYTVVLGSAPSASVVITITPDTEVGVNVSNLTFTTGNWDQPQTVTVTAVDDGDHELNHIGTITHSASSSDPVFNGILIDDVLVSITDDDNNAPSANAGPDQTVLLNAGNPGLYYGEVAGDIDLVTPNPETEIITDISTKTGAGTIPANTTRIFTGKIYDADGQISFTEHIDDKTRIWIDGSIVLSDDVWSARASTANLNLSPGWHDIEIRISNGTGGSGAQSAPGVGYDPSGGTTWQEIVDPGDGSLLSAGLAPVDANLNGVVSDPDGDPLTTFWSTVSGPGPVSFDDVSITNATATFLQEGVYTLRLSASDTITQVVDEVVITVTTNALPPAILAPSDLSATAVATNQINLAWTDNSANETGFVIERSTTSGSGFAQIVVTAADATSYSDTGLAIGQAYYYRMYATNATDSSAMTAEVSATTPKMAATVTLSNLTQPYNGTARAIGVTTVPAGLSVDVTYGGNAWAPTNAGSYAVVATINEPSYEGSTNGTLVVAQATPTVTTWPTASGIIDGSPLSSSSLNGGSASVPGTFSFNFPSTTPPAGVYEAAVTFIPTDSVNFESVAGTVDVNVGPAAPTGLAGIPSVGKVNLSWNASTGASSYKVKRSATSGSGYSVVGTPAVTNYTDTTVNNGQTYYYVVSAVSTGAEGPDSGEVSVTLPNVVPFVEDFEALATNNLAGQRLWAGSNAVVEAGIGVSGSQGLNLGAGTAEQTFSNGTNTVNVRVWCKPVPGEEPSGVAPDSTAVFWVDTNLYVRAYSNTTAVTLPAQINTNNYTRFEVGIDYGAGTWQISVNGTNAASGLGVYSNRTRFSTIRFENTTAKPFYIDDISITSATAAPTAYEIWLTGYGLTTADSDSLSSNGINTVLEAYIAGLDPTDPASRFEITGVGTQGSAFVLEWPGETGHLYNVYWATNLMNGFILWQSNVPWNATSITNTDHAAENQGFYRIDVQLE